jgi:feruloyl esterase
MIERLLRCGILLGVALPAATGWAQSCENLVKLSSPTVSISIADAPMKDSVCRVVAMLKPTPDSDIGVEVWLPVANWNGKFLAVGSGGWGGTIATAALADGVRRGYAVAATDDGHKGGSASFAMGHPEKLIDFAWRAEHEMTVEAKLLIKAFYGRDPKYSYWNGCSGGGREGLLQAARYPEEFDGIIAGDPANIRRNAWALWLANGTFKDPAAYIPPAKYPMIHQAVLNACDAKDGLKDGLIEDPQSCHPDFKQLECKHGDGPDHAAGADGRDDGESGEDAFGCGSLPAVRTGDRDALGEAGRRS